MKKKKIFLALMFAMVVLMMGCIKKTDNSFETQQSSVDNSNNSAILKSASILPDAQISSVILYAGQTINAGTVTVSMTDTGSDLIYDAFKVTYTLTGGWQFNGGEAVKFYLGTTVPTDNTPGLFPYKYIPGAGTTTYTALFSFSTFGFDGCAALPLYIAAHADLQKQKSDGSYQTETGWGNGTDFPGHGWSMYYSFDLTDKTPPKASDVTLNVECIGDVPAQTTTVITDASDNCGLATDPVTFVSEVNDGNFCPTTIVRTYLITDAAGNTSNATFTITVKDKTAPVLSGQGANIPLACSSDRSFTAPSVTDNCDAAPVLSYEDVVTATNVTRTWIATDRCGNVSLPVSQTITFDLVPPVLSGQGANAVIDCSATPVFTAPTATDNYDANPVVTIKGADVVQTVGYITSTTRTWIATDKCGNSSEVSQTIVKDCTPVAPPSGWLPGAGTGWAYDQSLSTAFNLIPNKSSNNWGWTNKLTPGTHVFTLYVGAGQSVITKGTPVGSVTVNYNTSGITVKYEVISLCNITEAHVWVGTTLLPMKKGSYISSPGQLGYNSGTISTTTYTFNIPNTFGSSDIYIAAHAGVVVK